jgi:ribonucleoside-diphosphate reductase alpha chain
MDWHKGINYPEFLTEAGLATLSRGYLVGNETPKDMYLRLANAVAMRLKRPELAAEFFAIMWKGWLCPSSPLISNLGTERGLPISCFSLCIPDSLVGIYDSYREAAMLTQGGGGLGLDFSSIRPLGAPIKGNGKSSGVVPWAKVMDAVIAATNQGGTRKGAAAAYLKVDHPDIKDFIKIRQPKGDPNRQCLNLHNAVVITEDFMAKCEAGDEEAISLWKEILYLRLTTGEPYLTFEGNAQKADPAWYKDKGLSSKVSNLCNEIYQHTDEDHTFVCCLASMNIAKFDEWKDTNAVQLSIWFLDGVMQEFIDRAKDKPGFERSIRSAEKGRALGLGWLGFHTYLQSKMIPFEGLQATFANKIIAKKIFDEAEQATKDLAAAYGEPEWLKGHGRRNSHHSAIAPTATNSILSGQVSPGIEPLEANVFNHATAKGDFLVKNPELEKLLEARGFNDEATWMDINAHKGSVQHLKFLSDEEKEVFKTARELNQFSLVKLAADRQPYICQGQSLNLFFTTPDAEAKEANPELADEMAQYIHEVHKLAYTVGLKGLYYLRSEGAAKGDVKIRKESDCESCSG